MKRNIKEILFLFISLMIFIVLICKNCCDANFLEANLVQIVTLMLATFVAFYISQKLTDKRRKIDLIQQQLNDIQNLIANSDYIFSIEDTKRARILQKSTLNKIKHIKDYSFPFIFQDIEYISECFVQLKELYDEHSACEEDLQVVSDDIFRIKMNISDKIDKIKLMLYE